MIATNCNAAAKVNVFTKADIMLLGKICEHMSQFASTRSPLNNSLGIADAKKLQCVF